MLQVRLNLQVNLFPNQVNLFQPRSICFKLDQLVSTLRSTCFDLDPFGTGKKHMSQTTSHRDMSEDAKVRLWMSKDAKVRLVMSMDAKVQPGLAMDAQVCKLGPLYDGTFRRVTRKH